MNLIDLFVYTLTEYKRFSEKINYNSILDNYDEEDYININVKLVLLRKYGSKNDNVYIPKVINKAIAEYPEKQESLEEILNEYENIEKQQLELILEDGTKLNLYQAIEDVMYGVYLHADESRINRLKLTDENLRFACVRKYVKELEKILYRLYDILKDSKKIEQEKVQKQKASVIYLGDNKNNTQAIEKTEYWSNLYGRDGSKEDVEKLLKDYQIEEYEIQLKCLIFLEVLESDDIKEEILDKLIFPATKKDWGDYSEASKFYKSIKNPGISTMIRYNDEHTMAYVRIFPQVDEVFVIDTPHIINDIYEICLVKENKDAEWKIYSLGGHLDSYLK